MFERNEILAFIVTLGKYSDAIQFVEDMEGLIEVKRLKANIQGYVEIDNEQKEDKETLVESEDTSSGMSGDFDRLMEDTVQELFASNTEMACNKWVGFCGDKREGDMQNDDVARRICNLYQQHCSN